MIRRSRDRYEAETTKLREAAYPDTVSAEHHRWLETKPFRGEHQVTVRHLVDVGYVFDLLHVHPGQRWLELGCGSGWLSLFAARQGAVVTGLDISPGMIEIARANASAAGLRAEFAVADIEGALPVDPGQHDVCVIYEALHHTTSPLSVLRSAHAALSPGGRILVVEPNVVQRWRGRHAALAHGVREHGWTPGQYRRMLRSAGFSKPRRLHPNRRRLYGNSPTATAAHLVEPLAFRMLASWRTQVWMTASR